MPLQRSYFALPTVLNTTPNNPFLLQHLTPEGQEGAALEAPGEDWVPVGGAVVVSEKKEHIVNSHQVAENRKETEEVVHVGDVSNQVRGT